MRISQHGTTFVMRGTDPGNLFLVLCMCVRLVKRSVHLVVGLGAAIIGGASVMHCIMGGGGLVSAATLCSTLLDPPNKVLTFGGKESDSRQNASL